MIRTVLLASISLAAATPALAETQAILVGNLIPDAVTGPTGPAVILVEDGRIKDIAQGTSIPFKADAVVDLSTKTVVPGFIDLHVHLTGDPGGDFRDEAVDPDEWGVVMGVKNAALTVKAGFTTVREAGSAQNTAFVLRRGTAEGKIVGPRIVAAGPALSIVGGHADVTGFRKDVLAALDTGYTCTGPVECAEKVRKSSRLGSDVIKITATGGVLSQQGRGLEAHFTDAEMKSIADTAHSLGLKVMAHAHGARGIEAASAAGIDSIEHGTFADEAALKVMKAKGTVLVPTLMALEGVRARLGKGIYTPTVEVKARQALEAAGRQVTRAKAMGVTVAFGTDAGVFEHGSNGKEFALLVKAGLTPTEALASATTVAAKTLGMENEIGKIAVGYSADLVAVRENPLTNISTLENPSWVMVRGRIVP
ncbi:amidohydrolase family protein [Sphingorhabdus sp. IMCC26285]|uniref:Amidohydrolase family protein n=1 Tax=Sphingorhabdus profundilacus TaxID=2509718 RepID=A0A6I4LY56_9SPHN|nr:amidohydrolase family protein [Sphingorhabdus profundilacus]MVZ97819.1 amidohydrolase family protein [Sphingorhabdus profundilacus]